MHAHKSKNSLGLLASAKITKRFPVAFKGSFADSKDGTLTSKKKVTHNFRSPRNTSTQEESIKTCVGPTTLEKSISDPLSFRADSSMLSERKLHNFQTQRVTSTKAGEAMTDSEQRPLSTREQVKSFFTPSQNDLTVLRITTSSGQTSSEKSSSP